MTLQPKLSGFLVKLSRFYALVGGLFVKFFMKNLTLLVFVLRNAANYSAAAAAAALRTYLTMGLPLGPTTMAV